MLENRSLDNLLGWLYATRAPKNMVPPLPEGSRYDGLREGAYSLPLKPHDWSPVSWYPIKKGVGSDGTTTPNLDPYEDYPHVLNQIFGNATNSVNTEPPYGTTPAMQGFLQDFDSDFDTWDETLQITETYTPASNECPILNGLAAQYAVSDRWYCSMPTQTNPNRAFSLCGTSLGRLSNLHLSAIEQFHTPTIWNVLAQKNVSMGIYYHEIWHEKQCYTQYTFPYMNQVSTNLLSIVKIDDPVKGVYARARAGTLPAFTYIEPKWGYGISYDTSVQGNDYHPPTDIVPGEKLLWNVYTALISNAAAWKNTLLIVTFDEHGGTYDHHSPVWGAVNPGDPWSRNSPFDFHLYGVRVPTLLISPYVPPSTVFRAPLTSLYPYDHTSILATLLRWQGINPATAGLYNRVAVAPTFEGVLRGQSVNEGVELADPAPRLKPDPPATHILEGIPAATKKSIVMRARSLEAIQRMADDYRAHVKE
jgi:phospholipase C